LPKPRYLEAENAYLKKLQALAKQKIGKQEQMQVIAELWQQYHLQAILGIVNIFRNVYYYKLSASTKADLYLELRPRLA